MAQRRRREGITSDWGGGCIAWYWPDDQIMIWFYKNGAYGFGEGIRSLSGYPQHHWNEWSANQIKNRHGRRFKTIQEGLDLQEQWLTEIDNEGKIIEPNEE